MSVVSTENIGYIEPDAVVAGTAWGAGWNDPADTAKIYKTTDYGDTWTAKLSVATSLGSISGQRVVPHPNGTTLFALIIDATGGIGNSRMYVYRSDDGGENWTQKINTIPTTSGVSGHISLDRDGNRLLVTGYYALDTRNVYESMDQGDSWSNLADIASVRFSGCPTPNSDGVFLANVQEQPATADFLHSIYRSSAPGLAFSDMGDLAVGDSIVKAVSTIATDFAFAVPQGNPSVFYAINNSAVAGVPGRIYKSVDGGSSWTLYNEEAAFDWTALAAIEAGADDRRTFLSLMREGGKELL